ncbi:MULTISPECIES: phytanoyl-CoA dioxygenase family protein [unclassified Novosphingobium]|uniref:phytanoyl-CoA dioxygenase family protein n=1 Tax=unclassified Novosphingobium TaxID=2644732 RepID=UPI0025EB5062|nr:MULTISPECIES: phytanoyl-CoA dioxygenase family protein [unclassified Novosphingobium]HQV03712.1 phytanoyl-CoA dioxygenase family protein [Novosphingobium sp.]
MTAIADQGYALLPGAVPPELVEAARAAFEAGYLPPDQWPVPRDPEWRLAQVDLDPAVQAICHLPAVLEQVGALIEAPFFLMQIDGRDPRPGNRCQPLHRDAPGAEHPFAIAMVFLDDYGPDNGATQLVPATHRGSDDGEAMVLAGRAGDIAVLDANLLHGGTSNTSGAPRRSLLITWADTRLREELVTTEKLRGVRMDTGEVFVPTA